jgi:RHS repeat-associated protein
MRNQLQAGLAVLAVLSAYAWSQPALSAVAGRTPGTFAVSPTGAATYTIPIWVPPGPAGLQPSIALVYNSQAGGGVMGPGWSVAGLSAITRCNKTYAQDGVPAAVTFTYADAFCADGTRLRLTSSDDLNTYGQDGTTYQTEIADFSNFTAKGTAGNGPSYFTVQRKNGLTYEYGVGGNSQVLAGSTVVAWLLDKVTDRAGNTMTIAYKAPSSTLTGMTIPASISWTPTVHGSSAYSYTMTFDYNTANTPPSSIFAYVAGNAIVNQDLLLDINITDSSGATIKKYVFTYDNTQSTTGATRLQQIRECSDSAGNNCLLPTAMTYQSGVPGTSMTATTVATNADNGIIGVYDLNGDGYDDLLYADANDNLYVAFGSTAGFGTPMATGINVGIGLARGPVPFPLTTAGYLHGTAQASILVSGTSNTWLEYMWNGQSFAQTNTGVPIDPNTETFVGLADVNGDGVPDLVTGYVDNNTITLYTRINQTQPSGALAFAPTRVTAYSTPSECNVSLCRAQLLTHQSNKSSHYLDFNGDGLGDLIVKTWYASCISACRPTPATLNDIVLLATGSGTFSQAPLTVTSASGAFFTNLADINDDGCTDIVVDSIAYLSGCNGNAAQSLDFGAPVLGAMDWNGDGRADVLVQNSTTLGVYPSNGNALGDLITTGMPTPAAGYVYTANDIGDGLDSLVTLSGATISLWPHNGPGQRADLLSSITDGYGNSVSLTYAPFTQTNGTWGVSAAPGYQAYVGPLYIVTKAVFSDPSTGTGTCNQTYQYGAPQMNIQGRGFAGFSQINSYDSRTILSRIRDYLQVFPFTGMQFNEQVSDNTNFYVLQNDFSAVTTAEATLHATANNQRFFPRFASSTGIRVEGGEFPFDANVITQTSATYTYDDYGNETAESDTITDFDYRSPGFGQSWTTSTTATFSPDTSTNWCLNQPTQIVVTKTSPGSSITRTTSFTPDYVKCRPQSKTTEPGQPAYTVTESFGYDSFGNVQDDTVTGAGMTPRNTHTDWGTTGQFQMAVTDPLLHTTMYNYNFDLGFRTSATDPNGVVVSWSPDAFGRELTESRPDGTSTGWSYADCASSGGCLIGSHGLVVTQTVYNVGGTQQTRMQTYYDPADRPLLTSKLMESGAYDRNEQRYDSLGRIAATAMPCTWSGLTTSCPYWSTNTYDPLNRLTQVQRPISEANGGPQTTVIQNNGLTTTVTDPQGKVTTRYMSPVGTLLRSQDHDNYYQSFNYDAFGSLVGVSDSLSNQLFTAAYDYGIGAFQRDVTDADLDVSTAQGQHRHFNYDALGELVSWTDAKNQSFSETYDALSRPLVRSEPDLTTTWTWGNSAADHNIGKLAGVSANSYAESYTYDAIGRQASRLVTIPSDGTYEYDLSYSSTTGLLDTLTYPVSTSGYRLKLQYSYQSGYQHSISDFNEGTVFWQANSINARGQVTQETLGNNVITNRAFDAVTGLPSSVTSGVSGGGGTELQNDSYLFDQVGNLIQRQNGNTSLTESFYYDDVYRLDHSTLNGTTNLQMHYDATGNITSRSDLAGGATWTYDANRKHAVTQAGNAAYQYAYDANGNVTSRDGYSIIWTSFNHPSAINSGGESVQFAYTQDHTRYSAIYSGSAGVETTYFITNLLEKVISAGSVDYRHYIYAGGTKVAIYSRTSAGTNTVRYVREDHLGGVSGIENSDGSSYVKESFTAFGARRSACTWSGPPTAGSLQAIDAVSRRGFTWQTALGNMGLNDMNGRIEDATTGRFLSPDPLVTDPGSTQSFNRYSYVQNNPLTYTDPNGLGQFCFMASIDGPGQPGSYDPTPQPDAPGGTIGINGSYSHVIQICYSYPDAPPGGGGGGGGGGPGNGPPGNPPPLPPNAPTKAPKPQKNQNQNKPPPPPCSSGPSYMDRYTDFVSDYAINVGPYAAALAGGLWPKSLAPATLGRGPLLGSTNPLTSVPRALGIPGADSMLVRTGAAGIGLATVGIGFYDLTIELEGFLYAIPSQGSGSCTQPQPQSH